MVAISDSHCTGSLHTTSLQGDGDKIKEAKRNTEKHTSGSMPHII